MRYVVAYDLKEDRVCARVSAGLQTGGSHVQDSFFVCDTQVDAINCAVARYRELISSETDSLYIF